MLARVPEAFFEAPQQAICVVDAALSDGVAVAILEDVGLERAVCARDDEGGLFCEEDRPGGS